MLEIKKHFSDRELLWFGPLFALFMGIVGAILRHRFSLTTVAFALWCAAGIVIVVYYLLPSIRTPTYRAWLYAVFPIGWVISHVLLGAIYYILLTPIGLVMRIVGYDPMTRHFAPTENTYWIDREPDVDQQRYFRQF